jgi:hypothetical protein
MATLAHTTTPRDFTPRIQAGISGMKCLPSTAPKPSHPKCNGKVLGSAVQAQVRVTTSQTRSHQRKMDNMQKVQAKMPTGSEGWSECSDNHDQNRTSFVEHDKNLCSKMLSNPMPAVCKVSKRVARWNISGNSLTVLPFARTTTLKAVETVLVGQANGRSSCRPV